MHGPGTVLRAPAQSQQRSSTMTDTIHIPWQGWHLGRKLGSGSFGMVYEITRTVGDSVERAAMKVISYPKEGVLEELQSEGYPPESIRQMCSDCKKDLLREYGMMMQLKGHSNIVSCEDYTTEDRADGAGFRMYIRMELLTPLRDVLRKGSLSEQEIARLGRDLCKALIICHDREIIHRDIKPQNIFVSDFGDYKLGDFGVARRMEGTANATVAGTTNYMAPEVYRNEPYGKDADLYSLGMVLYYLLNERRMPFIPVTQKIATAQEEAAALFRRIGGEPIPAPVHGSPAFQKIVLRAIAFDRRDRYTTARELLDDLQDLHDLQEQPADAHQDASHQAASAQPQSDTRPLWNTAEESDSATVSALHPGAPLTDPSGIDAPVFTDPGFDAPGFDETVAITGIASPAASAAPAPAPQEPSRKPIPKDIPAEKPVQDKTDKAPSQQPAAEQVPLKKDTPEVDAPAKASPSTFAQKLPRLWVNVSAAGAIFNCVMGILTFFGFNLFYTYGYDFSSSMFWKQHSFVTNALIFARLGIWILLLAGVILCLVLLRRQKKVWLPLGILGFLSSLYLFLVRGNIYWAMEKLGLNGHTNLPVRNAIATISIISAVVFMVLNLAVPYWGKKVE